GQITVATDGTKVLANASKHSAVSYQRAGEVIERLDNEVKELIAKAEQADSTPLQDGLSIPEEITRRAERKAALAHARTEIEARAHARYIAQLAEHEQKLAERAAKEERGEKSGGKPPQGPTPDPQPKDQYNFTDPESRIMKAGSGQHFEQSYNAQAAVEVDSRLPNDIQSVKDTSSVRLPLSLSATPIKPPRTW
ncbi:MAG: IS5/IS1182 family transposase, partial [Verrucomicrobia bacterium]|nr:IS5/IS1182 family transposase [Verrucomicrobiota bacterium]